MTPAPERPDLGSIRARDAAAPSDQCEHCYEYGPPPAQADRRVLLAEIDRLAAAPATDAGLDVKLLTTVLYDWMPDGADVCDPDNDGQGIHLTGADLARFIFDAAAGYTALSRQAKKETA